MAAPSLSELEPMLASLNQLKPPGASRNKITAITQLSMTNVQAEQHITQCMYRALKKAPSTHKLGALYVIDSVIRQWIDAAKKAGQDLQIDGRGEPGTFPAAVKRVTELMPALMDDIVKVIPVDQKPKLENMIAIWERASTFPAKLLEDFRKKLSEPQSVSNVNGSGVPHAQDQGKQSSGEKFRAPVPTRPLHTPVGYPPQRLYDEGILSRKGEPLSAHNAGNVQQTPAPVQQPAPSYQAPAAPPQDVNSILAALANAAPKPTPPQPMAQQPPAPPANAPPQLPPQLAAMFGNGFPPNPAFPPQATPFQQPPASQPPPPPFPMPGFQPPPNFPGFPPQQPPSIPQPFAQAPPPPQPAPAAADPLAPLRSILPQNIVNDQAKLMQALSLLQDLQKGGLPMEQWGPILQAFSEQADGQAAAQQQQQQQQQPPPQLQNGGYDGYNQSRDRSRSPDRERRGGGRGSPSYGAYEGPEQQEQRNGRGGRDKGRYRQRSPMRNNGGNMFANGASQGPKNVYFDNTLPPDHIRVFSRTLFVGGANGSQQEISELFGRFGEVASCIPNREKRHAFVKMTTREHTLNAKAGVEALQNANDRETMSVARQTKWGVGFGPRECFDYQKGESVIPIGRLTEADMKWMLTAEYGGTGGQQLEAGMAIEEPDIEIGAGVSSKAMSKRVAPDGGQHGGNKHHNKHEGGHGGGHGGHGGHGGKGRRGGRFHHHNRDDVGGGYGGMPPGGYQQVVRPEPVAVATPPAVPGFGFSLPGAR